jgi:hypothetical protein
MSSSDHRVLATGGLMGAGIAVISVAANDDAELVSRAAVCGHSARRASARRGEASSHAASAETATMGYRRLGRPGHASVSARGGKRPGPCRGCRVT